MCRACYTNPMTTITLPPDLLCKDPQALGAKLARFQRAGGGRMHMVFDFDRTLTVARDDMVGDTTSWGILHSHLPETGQQRCSELFNTYRPKELDGTLTKHEAITWWSSVLDIYAEYKLDFAAVEADFLARASIRPGAAELFQLARAHGIPTVVLSAGTKDTIDLWNATYGVAPSLVISTVLQLDDKRRVVGWHPGSLVHTLSKDEADHEELAAIRAERPFAIVVGDSLHDASMASGEAQTLRVRILDPRPDETYDPSHERHKTFERFDAIIETQSMAPLGEVLAGVLEI